MSQLRGPAIGVVAIVRILQCVFVRIAPVLIALRDR